MTEYLFFSAIFNIIFYDCIKKYLNLKILINSLIIVSKFYIKFKTSPFRYLVKTLLLILKLRQ